jgi:hypothetical protein
MAGGGIPQTAFRTAGRVPRAEPLPAPAPVPSADDPSADEQRREAFLELSLMPPWQLGRPTAAGRVGSSDLPPLESEGRAIAQVRCCLAWASSGVANRQGLTTLDLSAMKGSLLLLGKSA